MKYTVKTFIQALFGGKECFEILKDFPDDKIIIVWTGYDIMIQLIKKNWEDKPILMDRLSIFRIKPGLFALSLSTTKDWWLNVEFSDGGLKKNKRYNVEEYIK